MHDADGSVIQSLSLNILGDNKSALSSIDETITALVSLQATAVRMRDGVNVIKDLANSLQKLSKVKIPNSVPEQLQKIDDALKGTYGKGASGMKNVADAMQDIADNANKLPVAEQFDKAKNTAGEFNYELESVKENIQTISGLLPALTDATKAIPLPAPKKTQVLGLPEKSSAQSMKILEETAVDLGKIQEYQTEISAKGIIDLQNLKSANTEITEFQKKLLAIHGTSGVRVLDNQSVTPLGWNLEHGSVNARSSRYYSGQMYDGRIGPYPDFVRSKPMLGISNASDDIDKTTASANRLATGLRAVGTEAKNTAKWLLGITASGIGKGVRVIGSEIKDLGKKTIGTNSKLFGLWRSIKRIATYRAIRAALKAITNGFKEGISNLYKWSDAFDSTREFANSMDRIATAVLYVKNSLGAMVAPIVNAVAPAIDYLADKFVGLLNIINEFIAAMTGAATYTVAKKIATQYQEIGDSASGAAKAMKSFTIGIDELNIIEDTSGGRGGAGTLGDVTKDWFEKQEVSNDMKTFTDAIKQAAEDAKFYMEYLTTPEGWQTMKESVRDAGIEVSAFITPFPFYVATIEGFKGVCEDLATEVSNLWEEFKKDPLKFTINHLMNLTQWLTPLPAYFEAFTNPINFFETLNKVVIGLISPAALPAMVKLIENLHNNLNTLKTDPLGRFEKLGEVLVKMSAYASPLPAIFKSWEKHTETIKKALEKIEKIINKITSGEWDDIWSSVFGGGEEKGEAGGTNITDSVLGATTRALIASTGVLGNAIGDMWLKSANQAKNLVRSGAYNVGTTFINGTKDGMSANATTVYNKIGSIGSQMVSTFKSNASYSSFKSAGENIVNGIIAGLDAKKGQVYNSISVLASKTGSKFNYTLKIQSPSRVFMESGEYIDEGLALGIDRNAYKVEDSVAKLSNTFTNFAPAIDTSKLSIPDAQALYGDVQGAITADSKVSVQRADESLQNFIMETLMPVVTRIADDTKRQADKSEVIEIDGRKLNDSLNRQSRNNGYSFT